MTAQTTDFSGLLYYNPVSNGFNPVESASLTCTANPVNEGQTNTFNIVTWNIPDGTTIYWKLNGATNLLFSRFDNQRGTVTVTNNRASFTLTASANNTTAPGAQYYSVAIGKTFGGTDLAILEGIVVNDTSQDPVPSTLTSGTSLAFNGTDNHHVIVSGTQSDWNLGNNWTIEWWQKIPVGASGFLSVLCQDANVPTYSGIDVYINAGNICMFNGGRQTSESAATRGQWNHIALQKNGTDLTAYINGVAQTFNGSHSGTITPSSPLNVCIGSRTWDGGTNFYGQYFNGELANIRISNIARYSATFQAPTTVTVDSNTKLALDGSASGMLDDASASDHTITNNSAIVTQIGTTYTGTSGFASGSLLSYIILASFGAPFNTNYPAPGDLTGWTVTGGGISGSATVTGNTQDLGGGTLHIPIDQAFLQQTGEYIFTAP